MRQSIKYQLELKDNLFIKLSSADFAKITARSMTHEICAVSSAEKFTVTDFNGQEIHHLIITTKLFDLPK